ncbi:MAG: hypothetical protein V1820_06155 [archaeon]
MSGNANEPEKKPETDIPLWAVLLMGVLMMGASFAAVFFLVGGGDISAPVARSEEWEYWGSHFHLKIKYNTSEPVIATKNSVQVGRGCNVQINSSITPAGSFKEKMNLMMKRSGDIVIQNATNIGSLTAEIQTALTRIYAYYCYGRTFTVTTGKYCKFDIIVAACEG